MVHAWCTATLQWRKNIWHENKTLTWNYTFCSQSHHKPGTHVCTSAQNTQAIRITKRLLENTLSLFYNLSLVWIQTSTEYYRLSRKEVKRSICQTRELASEVTPFTQSLRVSNLRWIIYDEITSSSPFWNTHFFSNVHCSRTKHTQTRSSYFGW